MLLIGFGDSITAGVFMEPEDSYLNRLKRSCGIEIVNAGVPGNTTTQALLRMQEDVLNRQPDFCTVQFGMNDHYAVGLNQPNVPRDVFRSNLEQIVHALKAINCEPILCTIHPIIEGTDTTYYYSRHPRAWYESPPGVQAWIDSYNEIIRAVATQTDTRLADVAERWERELCAGRQLEELLLTLENSGRDDGVHPTVLGHALYAECIGELLVDQKDQ